MHLFQGGSGKAAASRLKCPGGRETFYEGFDTSVAVCSNCFEKRKAHKLPSIKGPASPHSKQDHSNSACTAMADPTHAAANSHMMSAVRVSSAPHHPSLAPMKRPLPHWKSWFECLDAEGKPIGRYFSATRSQNERPELPLPLGWTAEIDPRYSTTYYVQTRAGTSLPTGWAQHTDPASGKPYYVNEATGHSQWNPPAAAAPISAPAPQWTLPLPLYWNESTNPDNVSFYVRALPGLPEVAQSTRPLTFAFCPNGHPLRSYCDR
jgi:hypothetical protein